MPRTCMHLLAWLSVAAFFFANMHMSSALAALGHPTKISRVAPAKRTCCSHCHARQAKPISPHSRQPRIAAEHGDQPSCPCGPKSCPCPDKCLVCNVANFPVTIAAPVCFEQAPALIEAWTDSIALHFTANSVELMRPPR